MMKHAFSARHSIKTAFVTAVALAACCLHGAPATAQPASIPSYATGEEHIRGRIASFDGKYNLQVRDDRGFIDNVRLHDGTIINPTGLRLHSGQSVTIFGHSTGKTFEAYQIDTPYGRYGGVVPYAPYPAYYGYAVPYGYYGYGYPYRAYPAFGFGFRGWF